VHLDDHLWRFILDRISISTKKGRVSISPAFPKILWRIASEARFRLLKGNVAEFFIVFKKDVKPYEPKAFIPVDLNEDSVSSSSKVSPYCPFVSPGSGGGSGFMYLDLGL